MLTIISPAKKLDYSSTVEPQAHTQPELLSHAKELLKGLKTLSPQDVCALMGLSDKLGALNYERFQEWRTPFNQKNARQAVLAFKGDVYQGLDAQSMSAGELAWAQDNLRILSGLYGLLRPLDLMQPYRLEMGTKYSNARGNDLYKFWGNIITDEINKVLVGKTPVLLNLASNEYFKSVQTKDIKGQIISFYAKKARGLMSAYIIKNKIIDVEKIKGFDSDGYSYNAAMSEGDKWVFTRG